VIPSDLVVRNVTVFLGQVLKQQNRIRGAKPAKGEPQKISLKAGREAVIRGAAHVIARHVIASRSCHLESLLGLLSLFGEETPIEAPQFPASTKSQENCAPASGA
jgi:hypothetical protein